MDNMKDATDAISIFISYALAPQDETLLHEFEKFLTPLQRQGIMACEEQQNEKQR